MDTHEYDYSLNIVFLGGAGVGKTSLMKRYVYNIFDPKCYSTIGVDLKTKIVNIENKKIKVKIFDYGFSEHLRKFQVNYYRKAHGIIIVYDITDKYSFEEVREWLDQIELNGSPDTRKIIVGNKCDLYKREVPEEEGKKIADEFNINFFEVSSNTNDNVNEAFEFLIKDIINNNKNKLTPKLDLKKEEVIRRKNKFNK